MKFANVLRGTRATKLLEIPSYSEGDGKPFRTLLRPLTGIEHESAHADARERAIEKGVADPSLGDPIYDLALMACVIASGCLDPDSPEDARTPTFDNALQILTELHPEQIVYLHEHHEVWQNECSPTARRVDETNLIETVREVAGPEGYTTFMRFSPSTRVSFMISMARTLLPLLEVRSLPGSFSESVGVPYVNGQTPSPTTMRRRIARKPI